MDLVNYRNEFYVKSEQFFASLSPGRVVRVLMSDERPDWQGYIREGFNRTQHKDEFGPMSPESFGEFDLVVPLTIADVIRVCRCSSLRDKNPIPIPSEECVLLCDDKYAFNQTLIKGGFGRFIPRMGSGLEPPYILKKRTGEWGRNAA